MKKILCLLCLMVITLLSVPMAYASDDSLEKEMGKPVFENALYLFTVPPEEQEPVPTFNIINTITGKEYSSESEFYSEIGASDGIVHIDFVNHTISLIPKEECYK